MLVSTLAMGQISRISGTVSDDVDVLPGASVVEIDASNRILNSTVTDMNGNFVLAIKSPKNSLRISFMGFKTQKLPINKTVYKIKMEDATKTMKEVKIVAKKTMKTSGLAIPEREVSFSAQGISAKEFEGLGITSVDEALQGRIAGLDIVQSGDLGKASSMRLRGASTISQLGNEPLIVVNGNVWNVDQTDFDVSTANEERFAQLLNVNTEDIADIKVLKDAAATAIWGSQGANGVIEITTKRGSRGPARVTYSGKLTFTHQPTGLKLLNGDQYTMLLKESYFNPKQDPTAANVNELNYDENFSEYNMYNKNTDWVNLVRKTGLRQNHYISISGGDDKTLFRISGGYDHETGTVLQQKLDRFSTRMALDYFVNDRIKIISNFALTYTKNYQNSDDLLGIAYKKMPNLSPYEMTRDNQPTGEFYYMLQSADTKLNDQKGLANPLASAALSKNIYTTYDITPELELEYKLLGIDDSKTQLNYNGRVVMNVYNAYSDRDYPRALSTADYINTHSTSNSSSKSLAFTTTHTLNFKPHFKNEDHFLTMMGRFQLVSGSSSSQNNGVSRLPSGLTNATAGGLVTEMGSGFGQWRSLFYTFSAHYSYKSKYAISFSVRADATDKFGPSNRWGVFPAVSGRWNVIDEKFMKWAQDKIEMSMFGIRLGWGRVGNGNIGSNLYMNTYGSGNQYLGTIAMNPNGLKLTQLRWENKYTINGAFDLGFFEDRLKFVIDLYSQTTKGMLLSNFQIPSSNGYSSLAYRNTGNMRNNGWEFSIVGERLAKKGKFYLDVNVNFANNHNVITELDPLILETKNRDFERKNRALLQRVQVNNPFGAIYGFRYNGVYQYNYDGTTKSALRVAKSQGLAALQANIDAGKTYPVALNANGQVITDAKGDPLQMQFCYEEGSSLYKFKGGDAIYEDINHDGNINELDIVYLGNSLPKLTGGFGFKLHWDRLALNAQFNYRIDYDIFNMARLDMESMVSNNNQSQAVNYRWRKEGDVTSIPRAMYGDGTNYNTLVSDRFVEDGTFLRLNYLQLSYSFDTKLIKKWGFNQLSLYASANNLFCLTKYSGVDPEIGYGGEGISTDSSKTPRSKSYTVGVTIGF